MGDRTGIEWTDATWNPIRARNPANGKVGWHCSHVTAACTNCYAEKLNVNTFFGNGLEYKPGNLKKIHVYLDTKALYQPLRWRRGRKIFPLSMTDLFADFVTDEMIDQILAVCALTPRHTYQFLTKRPERMRAYMLEKWQGTPALRLEFPGGDHIDSPAGGETGREEQVHEAAGEIVDQLNLANTERDELWTADGSLKILQFKWPLPNVWFGTSIGDQADADKFVPELLQTPAAKRFVSAEPLLGHIHLGYLGWPSGETRRRDGFNALIGMRYENGEMAEQLPKLDWVICGGETGIAARPTHPDWARSLRDQCGAANIPFFFKQWGEWAPGENSSRAQTKTERVARLTDSGWDFSELTVTQSQHTHIYDEPDLYRLGRREAGRRLDGEYHDAFPEVA